MDEQKPVAWAADLPGKFGAAPTMLFGYTEKIVKNLAALGGDSVEAFPLYRHPAPEDREGEIERLKQRVAELAYAKEQLELRVLDLVMTRAKNALVTLTPEERAAIELAMSKRLDLDAAYTLRSLLERTK